MKVDKYEMYYYLMERWLTLYEQGRNIAQLLSNRNISTIALYGMGQIGKHVARELKNSSITVLYAIDRVNTGMCDDVPVKKAEDILPRVDAVIVTAIYSFEEIEETLRERFDCPIISLEEILYEG